MSLAPIPPGGRNTPLDCDVIVIGGGMAGASLAFFLAPHRRVTLLERESQPGYHTTGRSAALYMESYGAPQVRALTRASRAFFDKPPRGFTERPLLSPRGAMIVAGPGEEASLDAWWDALRASGCAAQRLDADGACALFPALRRERVAAAVLDVEAADIDVNELLQGFLRGVRAARGRVVFDAEVTKIERIEGGRWQVHAGGRIHVGQTIVNAAGAWVDQVAALAGVAPIGIEPRRRSAFVFAPPAGADIARWPMVADVAEGWYVKPDAGVLLGSPANADLVEPHDVQPEELDIATAIDRIQTMTTLEIRRPQRTWAGLRSFVPDGGLVGGFDPHVKGFFWLAAQGGYGIQTAPAMGEACASLVRGQPIPAPIAACGINVTSLSPQRLRRAAAAAARSAAAAAAAPSPSP